MHYIIEACDSHDRWGIVDAQGGDATFPTREAAQAALDDLVRVCGWDRDQLRVVSVPA